MTSPDDPRWICTPEWHGRECEATAQVNAGDTTVHEERWESGDVVLASNGGLWVRSAEHHIAQGWPWAYCSGYAPRSGKTPPPEGSVCEDYPVRPLVLLVRDGQPVGGAR